MFYSIFLICSQILSQPYFPEKGMLFKDDMLPRIDILIDQDSLDLIFEYPESDYEYPATFIFSNGIVNDTILEVGFRLRGNTSRWADKKSYKIAVNSFYSGRKYYELEKLNINGEHNDPSVARSKLCWNLLRNFSIPGSRSNHVQLYVNGDYYGVYINVEHIDEEFVLKRFENNDGNLYKCLWPANLEYLGSDPDLYKFENDGRRAYELKTNKSLDDYSDLSHFIDVLNNTSINDLKWELEKVFNVYDYLKVMAFDIATGNWDGYIYNKNNFYLYHNTASGRFEYIPYDLDNTFGIDWFGIDWAERNMYEWGPGNDPRPLYDQLLDVPRYRRVYSYYMDVFVTELINTTEFFPGMNSIKEMVYPYIENDPFYPLDYGYTLQNFLDSYVQAIGAHDPVGLQPFVENRNDASLNQLEMSDIAPVLNYSRHTPAVLDEEIWFNVFAEDNDPGMEVYLELALNGAATEDIEMFDDGQHHDKEANDGIFGVKTGPFTEEVELAVNIRATDINEQSYKYSDEPTLISVKTPEIPELYINEFMADNETIIADEEGKFEDWLEIYNAGEDAVYLGNLFLTDNFSNTDKWQMPDYTLAAQSFVLIWADNDEEQGMFHANFKMDKDGEEIGIYGPESMGFPVVDTVSFGEQQEDVSFGCFPDGSLNPGFLEYPTPGYSNTSGAGVDISYAQKELSFFPNPCYDDYLFMEEATDVIICNVSGQAILKVKQAKIIDISDLPKGFYLLSDGKMRAAKLVRY